MGQAKAPRHTSGPQPVRVRSSVRLSDLLRAQDDPRNARHSAAAHDRRVPAGLCDLCRDLGNGLLLQPSLSACRILVQVHPQGPPRVVLAGGVVRHVLPSVGVYPERSDPDLHWTGHLQESSGDYCCLVSVCRGGHRCGPFRLSRSVFPLLKATRLSS
uniref:(northern house mosquito) hypothetical protein n=1 Tax=Culex pipiens TaxID=7175 RepID=A0A8D8GV71_CULPI